jgi:hypothetical protein
VGRILNTVPATYDYMSYYILASLGLHYQREETLLLFLLYLSLYSTPLPKRTRTGHAGRILNTVPATYDYMLASLGLRYQREETLAIWAIEFAMSLRYAFAPGLFPTRGLLLFT